MEMIIYPVTSIFEREINEDIYMTVSDDGEHDQDGFDITINRNYGPDNDIVTCTLDDKNARWLHTALTHFLATK